MGLEEHTVEGTEELWPVHSTLVVASNDVTLGKRGIANHNPEAQTKRGGEEGCALTNVEVFPSWNLPAKEVEANHRGTEN